MDADEAQVHSLVRMGFSEDESRNALQAMGNDLHRAVIWIHIGQVHQIKKNIRQEVRRLRECCDPEDPVLKNYKLADDADEPLTIPKRKKKLSPQEQTKKLAERIRSLKELIERYTAQLEYLSSYGKDSDEDEEADESSSDDAEVIIRDVASHRKPSVPGPEEVKSNSSPAGSPPGGPAPRSNSPSQSASRLAAAAKQAEKEIAAANVKASPLPPAKTSLLDKKSKLASLLGDDSDESGDSDPEDFTFNWRHCSYASINVSIMKIVGVKPKLQKNMVVYVGLDSAGFKSDPVPVGDIKSYTAGVDFYLPRSSERLVVAITDSAKNGYVGYTEINMQDLKQEVTREWYHPETYSQSLLLAVRSTATSVKTELELRITFSDAPPSHKIDGFNKLAEGFAFERTTSKNGLLPYQNDTFDLNLAYITNSVMSLSMPGQKDLPFNELNRFFRKFHNGSTCKVYNLSTKLYKADKVEDARYKTYNIAEDAPPYLEALQKFVANSSSWLAKDSKNVVAVHDGESRGASCVAICALLVHTKQCPNFEAAYKLFISKRIEDQSYRIKPSLKQYGKYWDARRQSAITEEELKTHTYDLRAVEIHAPTEAMLKKAWVVVTCPTNPGLKFSTRKTYDPTHSGNTLKWEIGRDDVPLSGELRVDIFTGKTLMKKKTATVFASTLFLPEADDSGYRVVEFARDDIDACVNDPDEAEFAVGFRLHLTFK